MYSRGWALSTAVDLTTRPGDDYRFPHSHRHRLSDGRHAAVGIDIVEGDNNEESTVVQFAQGQRSELLAVGDITHICVWSCEAWACRRSPKVALSGHRKTRF